MRQIRKYARNKKNGRASLAKVHNTNENPPLKLSKVHNINGSPSLKFTKVHNTNKSPPLKFSNERDVCLGFMFLCLTHTSLFPTGPTLQLGQPSV
jgi:hypothetical protein